MHKKLIAAATAALCLLSCAACGKGTEISVNENVSGGNVQSGTSAESSENGLTVGDLVEPKEDSEEYNLGSYRVASDGVKYYYDDTISDELMFALDRYFTTFQNDDFDAYSELIFPDYKERYSAYLEEEYQYGLDESFELSRENLRTIMKQALSDEESGDTSQYTGDFTITRIKAEGPELKEEETIDELEEQMFSYLTEAFGMDYLEYVKENSDDLEYVCFYIYARGEDGEEHRLISGYDILFAVKDGKYFAFG